MLVAFKREKNEELCITNETHLIETDFLDISAKGQTPLHQCQHHSPEYYSQTTFNNGKHVHL